MSALSAARPLPALRRDGFLFSALVWLGLVAYVALAKALLDAFLPHAFASNEQRAVFAWPTIGLVGALGLPVATAWTHDLIASDDPHFCGRQGTIGDRAGNFTVQNSDLLLILGSRLCIRQISYNYRSFARHAFKIQVDVDAAELNKPTIKADLPVHADARLFLETMLSELESSCV